MSDHYNFLHGNGDSQRVFQRRSDSKTLPCLSKRVDRCRRKKKKLPCQRKGANSKDLFAVVVTTGELIIGREKFPQFSQFYDK